MRLAGFTDTSQRAPCAQQSRSIKPKDEGGSGKAKVESGVCKVPIADPTIARVERRDCFSKRGHVGGGPAGFPHGVEADDGSARCLSEPARERSLADSRPAEQNDSIRHFEGLVLPTGFEPAIFAVRGRCPKPLDDGSNRWTVYLKGR